MVSIPLLLAVVLGSVELSYSQLLTLSSSSTNASYCPGTIYLTCIGKGIPVFIDWNIDGSCAATYSFNDTYPRLFLPCPSSSLPPGVVLVVLSASRYVVIRPSGGVFAMNITAVLQGSLTRLRGSTIQCQSSNLLSELFYVKARVPVAPTDVVVQSTYDIDTLFMSRLDVQLRVPDSECSQVSYTVTLVNSIGRIEDQRMLLCGNGTLCTTFFTPPSSNQTYHVRIIATNDFGESSTSAWGSGPIVGLTRFNHSLTFEKCFTTVLCSSPMDAGECSIQYGQDSSYENLEPTIIGFVNTVLTLPFMKPNTLYYYQLNVTGNYTVQFRGNFTTGEYTCDIMRKSSMDGFVIAAIVISFAALLLVVIVLVAAAILLKVCSIPASTSAILPAFNLNTMDPDDYYTRRGETKEEYCQRIHEEKKMDREREKEKEKVERMERERERVKLEERKRHWRESDKEKQEERRERERDRAKEEEERKRCWRERIKEEEERKEHERVKAMEEEERKKLTKSMEQVKRMEDMREKVKLEEESKKHKERMEQMKRLVRKRERAVQEDERKNHMDQMKYERERSKEEGKQHI